MKKEEVTKLNYSPSIRFPINDAVISVGMTDHGLLVTPHFCTNNKEWGDMPLSESRFYNSLKDPDIKNLEKKLIFSHIVREQKILSNSANLIAMNYPKLFNDQEGLNLKREYIKSFTKENKHYFDLSNVILDYIMEADVKKEKQNPIFLFLYRDCPIMFAEKEFSNPYFMKRILLGNHESNFINSKMLENPSLRKKSSSSGFNRLEEAKNFFQDYSNFLKELIIKEIQVTNYLSGKTENSGESIKLTEILKKSSVTIKKINKAQRKAFEALRKHEEDLSESQRPLTDFELHHFFGMGKDAEEAMKKGMNKTGKIIVGGDCDGIPVD